MAVLIIKRRKGSDEEREVFDRVGLDEAIRQMGRRDKVSFDGGKTFMAKGKVKDEHKDEFLKGGGESVVAEKTMGANEKAARAVSPKRDVQEIQKIISSVQGVVQRDLLGAMEEVQAGILSSVQAMSAQFSRLTTDLAELQEELTAQTVVSGRAQGGYQSVMETLRLLNQEFEGRLKPEAIKAEITANVDDAVESTFQVLQGEFSNKLTELVEQNQALQENQEALDKKLKEIGLEQDFIEDLIDENRETYKRYKPGYIEVLKQKIQALGEEKAELEGRMGEQNKELDARDRQIARLLADDGAVEREDIQSKLEELAAKSREFGDKEALKVERDQLKEELEELREMRDIYEDIQRQREDAREVRGQLHESEMDRDQLKVQLEEAKRSEERTRKRASRLEENQERLEGRVSELIDELAERKNEFDKKLGEFEALKSREEKILGLKEENRLWVEELDTREKEIEAERAKKLEELRDENQEILKAQREQLERVYQEKRVALTDELARKMEARFQQDIQEMQEEVKRLAPFQKSYDELARAYEEETKKRVEWETGADERARCKAQEEGEIEEALEKKKRVLEELEMERVRLDELYKEKGELLGEKSAAQAELDGLLERLERRREEVADDEMKRKASIYQNLFQRHDVMSAPADEQEWLAGIVEKMEASGFVFPERLVKAFHTSLKIAEWAPLTVLAGVSGTGKSELPRLYSRYGGLHHQMISVKPNWDSPQDLLGFFNYMDNRYKATDLLKGLVQSQKNGAEEGFSDQLLLVLLDEMNLARVELYFSDFLSKLEARRGLEELPTIGVDLGAGFDEVQVALGRNVLFVGTMNEDETTMSLSDKVLDRGNVISFPRPKLLRSRDEHQLVAGVEERLGLRDWQSWVVSPKEGLSEETRQAVQEAMNKVNQSLRMVDRAIGHRVLQAIENYVANHPDVRGSAGDSDDAWKVALEDQIAQKIMPKLRGVETDTQAGRECLGGIKEVLDEYAEGLVDDFEQARKAGYGAFRWSSADYLEGGR